MAPSAANNEMRYLKKPNEITEVVRVYNKRWIILIIDILVSAISSFHWVEYSIITNILTKYYHVSPSDVDWTSMSFALAWPIVIFPACYIIDKMGLRVATLLATYATAFGSLVKIFSIGENRFWVVMIGQIMVAFAQIFILSLPTKLSVTWFKPEEVSIVCSLGMIGLPLGSALGFLIPPMLVYDSDNLDDIGNNLNVLCWGLSLAIAPVVLAVTFYFPAEPPHPPSQAMLEEKANRQEMTFLVYLSSLKTILKNKAFLLHVLCFSCNIAIFCSIGTFLNQLILSYFPGAQEDAGRMGLTMIVTGIIGSILIGFVLDKTHKYKATAFLMFLFSTLGMGLLAVALEMKSKWMVYAAIAIFGFFLNAYMPAGIEFATEITFPSPEATSTGIMMASSQTMTTLLIMLLGIVIEKLTALTCILIMIGVLAFGSILTLFTPNILNRQTAFMKDRNVEFIPVK